MNAGVFQKVFQIMTWVILAGMFSGQLDDLLCLLWQFSGILDRLCYPFFIELIAKTWKNSWRSNFKIVRKTYVIKAEFICKFFWFFVNFYFWDWLQMMFCLFLSRALGFHGRLFLRQFWPNSTIPEKWELIWVPFGRLGLTAVVAFGSGLILFTNLWKSLLGIVIFSKNFSTKIVFNFLD